MSERKEHNLDEIFLKMAHHIQEKFTEMLNRVSHPGESGVAREKLLIEFLKPLLPDRFGIGSGFVIDRDGKISKQIDIIIYDQLISTSFPILGELKYFPCETVVAIGEVKSTMKGRRELKDALSKIKSVQQLNRFSDYTNTEIALPGAQGFSKVPFENGIPPTNFRILSFIFTSEGLSSETMVDELSKYFKEEPSQYWPNLIVNFNQYLISYVKSGPERPVLQSFPDNTSQIYETKPEEKDKILMQFVSLLLDFLSYARVVRPMILDYFKMTNSQTIFHNTHDFVEGWHGSFFIKKGNNIL